MSEVNHYGRGENIYASNENDTIKNYAGDVYICALDGDDSIYSNVSYYNSHTVRGSYVEYENISGGYWQYYYYPGYVTINGGKGNDTIYSVDSTEVYIQYSNGDGNDVLLNNNGTIQILDGSTYTFAPDGNDQVIRIGDGSIRVLDAANQNLRIIGGIYQQVDTIDVDDTVDDNYDDNYFENSTANTLISGTAQADSIYNIGSTVTIDAGAGDDTIQNLGTCVLIDGGDGNDLINGNRLLGLGGNATVNGGAGDDTVGGNGLRKTFLYSDSDGNDVFTNYQSTDTINIADGSEYQTLISGSDVIVSIGNGSITLVDAADKTLNIVGGNPTDNGVSDIISNSDSNTLIIGTDDADSIRNTGSNVTIRAGAGSDIVSLDSSAENNVIQFGIGDGNDTVYGFEEGDTIQSYSGLRYITLESGNDIIYRLFDGSLTLKDAVGKQTYIEVGYNPEGIYNGWIGTAVDGTSSDDFIDNYAWRVTVNAEAGDDTVTNGWQASLSAIDAGDGNDLIFVQAGYETVEGGAGDDTIYADISTFGTNRVYKFKANDGDDLIIGYDSTDTINIIDGSEYQTLLNGDYVTVSLDGGSITLVDAESETLNIVSENILPKDLNVFNSTADTLISTGEGNDSIINAADNVTIDAGAGDDTVKNLYGAATLTGGEGADLFIYANGRDVIADYEEGIDKIQTEGCIIERASLSGDDVILYTDNNGSLTVKDAKDKFITVIDQAGNETSEVYGQTPLTSLNAGEFEGVTLKSSKIILEAPFSGTVDAANFSSKLKTIDASKAVDEVYLIGNDKNNKLTAGSGGSTLEGGGKNDKLYGGDGADVFIFDGQGKDKIYNYSSGDRIELTADITKAKLSGKNLKVTVEGGGVLTVNKILDVEMEITTADGQTNYYVFDKKHKTLDAALIESNQLATADYWFEQSVESDPLENILDTKNISVDFEEQIDLKNLLKSNEIAYSARSRHKK
ncbi:MAG: calcium-binding protein [Selenomonadaceae bacterium]|nr:calcium-binding protein [Selenomonadaceae bacterium]